jgi:hypothetical protein
LQICLHLSHTAAANLSIIVTTEWNLLQFSTWEGRENLTSTRSAKKSSVGKTFTSPLYIGLLMPASKDDLQKKNAKT